LKNASTRTPITGCYKVSTECRRWIGNHAIACIHSKPRLGRANQRLVLGLARSRRCDRDERAFSCLAHFIAVTCTEKKNMYPEPPVTRWSHDLAQEIRVSTGGVLDCEVDVHVHVHDGRWRACPCLKIGIALSTRRIINNPTLLQAGRQLRARLVPKFLGATVNNNV